MKKIIFVLIILLGVYFYNSDLKEGIFNENISKETKVLDQKINKTTDEIKFNIKNLEKIKLGDSKEYLVSLIGSPDRIDNSEYSFSWYVYNRYEKDFAMIGIEGEKVVAIYSNSINSIELENIKINDNKEFVRKNYKPLEYKKKGNTRYIINSNDQYDIINIDNKYITVFYDIYENNRVRSYQVVSEQAEESLNGMYPKGSENLTRSFELQTIDLVNSTRLQNGLNSLKYSEKATLSSRYHSEDMMEQNYFDHVNKNNESPFDRMKKQGIFYMGAGENIAAGQTSAVYAHEAWMNSEGHRKNILGDYKYIGVGVVFGGHYTIYYTQNFYI
ncbi:CAP-associated domain-containing protein [Clostridium sp. CCUG 7971]|uniref:CAP domain-containing protein n=1 Tax=Clostridium sp. CCUG 7971 TaxID=2811414 RepID=UPI001ABB18A5|nr:CAP-associated domain-containing protein [Clostridium sp. CCUG 7971]MBO3444996.1 peptidase [Clostridium sp. CCUG 7971]